MLGRAAALAGLCAGLCVGAATARANDAPVTPAGFRVNPVGVEIGVSKTAQGFQGPLGSALSPDGRYLLAASSGAARYESADLFNVKQHYRAAAQLYDARRGEAAFYGAAFSPDGKTAWVSGGGQDVVHVLQVDADALRETGTIPAGVWAAGLAYGRTPRGARLYVANNLGTNPASLPAPLTGQINPPGHTVTVIDPTTARVTNTIDLGAPLDPLGVAFSRYGDKAFVTQWMGRSVAVIDTATERKIADIPLAGDPLSADHPSAIATNPVRDEAYTANANSDTVSVIDTKADTVRATIPVGLVPGGPKGANPDGLAVAPDGRRLYVTLAGENTVAVVDLNREPESSATFPRPGIPPTSRSPPTAGGWSSLNTNDSGAGPNPCGGLSPKPGTPECAGVDRSGPPVRRDDDQGLGPARAASPQRAGCPPGRDGAACNNRVTTRALPEPPRSPGSSSTSSTSLRRTAPTTRSSATCPRVTATRP